MVPSDSPITVVIADPSDIARAGLRALLTSDPRFSVIGETARDVTPLARRLRPSVITLGTGTGDDVNCLLIADLREASPLSRVVVFAGIHEPHWYLELMLAGARGYLLKNSAGAEMVSLVLLAVSRYGMSVTDAAVADQLVRAPQEFPLRLLQSAGLHLSGREQEVLDLLARGTTDQEVAIRLSMSTSTVATHVRNISAKLGVSTRVALGVEATRRGLVRE